MAMAPFSTRPVSPRSERRRTRLALAIASVGIAATLLAYAVSPGVRHAVSHAAHSVKHAVSRVLDHDTTKHPRTAHPAVTKHPAARTHRAPAAHRATTTPRAAPPANGSSGAPAHASSTLPPANTSGTYTAPR
jgi:hypothetical protein